MSVETAPQSVQKVVATAVAKAQGLKAEDITDDTLVSRETRDQKEIVAGIYQYFGFWVVIGRCESVQQLVARVERVRLAI